MLVPEVRCSCCSGQVGPEAALFVNAQLRIVSLSGWSDGVSFCLSRVAVWPPEVSRSSLQSLNAQRWESPCLGRVVGEAFWLSGVTASLPVSSQNRLWSFHLHIYSCSYICTKQDHCALVTSFSDFDETEYNHMQQVTKLHVTWSEFIAYR